MNIEEVLKLPIEELKDYEFLTVAYIDKYSDILGTKSVSPIGIKQDSRKIMIVQGFNLYEQIQEEFLTEFDKIDKNKKLHIKIAEQQRSQFSVKLILVLIIIFISFFSMASLQNAYVKGCGHNHDKQG